MVLLIGENRDRNRGKEPRRLSYILTSTYIARQAISTLCRLEDKLVVLARGNMARGGSRIILIDLNGLIIIKVKRYSIKGIDNIIIIRFIKILLILYYIILRKEGS
jgi:hypothetical protein